jgi:cell division septal protein FtsQ
VSPERSARWRQKLRVAAGASAGALAVALPVVLWAVTQPLWNAVRHHPYFTARHVSVRGAGPLLSEQAVLSWLGIDERTSLWELSPAAVRARLEAHPLVARAVARRELPDRLSISLREYRPEAIAVLDRCYYVARNGRLLGALGAEHGRDYPLITGPTLETPAGVRTWLYRRALRLLRLCERRDCPVGISEVNVDARHGVVLYPVQPRVAVRFGWGSWRDKMNRFARVLRAEEQRTETIRAIDLRYRNQVVVERRAPVPQQPARTARAGMRV